MLFFQFHSNLGSISSCSPTDSSAGSGWLRVRHSRQLKRVNVVTLLEHQSCLLLMCCNCHVMLEYKSNCIFCIFCLFWLLLIKNNLKELSYQREDFYHLRAQCGSREFLHRSRKHPVWYTEASWLTSG